MSIKLNDSLLHPLVHLIVLSVFGCTYVYLLGQGACIESGVSVLMHCNAFVCLYCLSRVKDYADGAPTEVILPSLFKAAQ